MPKSDMFDQLIALSTDKVKIDTSFDTIDKAHKKLQNELHELEDSISGELFRLSETAGPDGNNVLFMLENSNFMSDTSFDADLIAYCNNNNIQIFNPWNDIMPQNTRLVMYRKDMPYVYFTDKNDRLLFKLAG